MPGNIAVKYATLVGNQALKKKAERFLKVSVRMSTNYELFEYFFRNDWCFESKKIFVILDKVSEEEKSIFNANTKTIDWRIHS